MHPTAHWRAVLQEQDGVSRLTTRLGRQTGSSIHLLSRWHEAVDGIAETEKEKQGEELKSREVTKADLLVLLS